MKLSLKSTIPFLMVGLYLLSIPCSLAATIVGGMITTDTVWDIGGSPYIAEQSVLVMSGAKLTIDPGIEVTIQNKRARWD